LGVCSTKWGLCSELFQGIERGIYFVDQILIAFLSGFVPCSTKKYTPAEKVFLSCNFHVQSKSKAVLVLGGGVYIFIFGTKIEKREERTKESIT
jgi:hypothetical protein